MSAHDKAAARHARRFTLTAIKIGDHGGYMQTFEYPNLTQSEIEARKQLCLEIWPAPYYTVDFEVASS